MATRTGTTRTTSTPRWPSADGLDDGHVDFSFRDLVQAYYDCRRRKRNTLSALAVEENLTPNLIDLYDELRYGAYTPGRSICFVVTRPKPREVWAADFRDRIVHHLIYNRIGPRFERSFVFDSCACIKGRGTLFAAKRLEHMVRSITQNWSRPASYLHLDIANFFVSIHKPLLWGLLERRISERWWADLTRKVLFHDPRENYEFHGRETDLDLVPPHKRLTEQPADRGLPIGNLSSQFFANVYLNVLDQHAKHQLKARWYVRYVDDMVFLDESAQRLSEIETDIEAFLPERLHVRLNPSKTVLQPVARGIDFVGQVIKPWRRETRKRTRNEAMRRVAATPSADLMSVANSYFGLLRQATASHQDRARLANVVRSRGKAVDAGFTKTYRGAK